jgi:hypothetical protein
MPFIFLFSPNQKLLYVPRLSVEIEKRFPRFGILFFTTCKL